MHLRSGASLVLVAALLAGCGAGSRRMPVTAASAGTTKPSGTGHLYRISSGSMEPTYPIGSGVYVFREPPRVGAVAVFHPPVESLLERCGPVSHPAPVSGAACAQPIPKEETAVALVKRIVAGPGDRLYIRAGRVYRAPAGQNSFKREAEPYARECPSARDCEFTTPITIPPGHWFLMGDNRGESSDSRSWGPVPGAWIIGLVEGAPLSRRAAAVAHLHVLCPGGVRLSTTGALCLGRSGETLTVYSLHDRVLLRTLAQLCRGRKRACPMVTAE